jgi:hypothetical protein
MPAVTIRRYDSNGNLVETRVESGASPVASGGAVSEKPMVLTGRLTLEHRDENGKLKQIIETDNLVVSAGKEFIKERVLDSVSPSTLGFFDHIAVGTDGTAPSITDLALISPLGARLPVATYTPGGTGVATIDATFGAGISTGTWMEAGVFSDLVAGTMLNRVAFGAVVKAAGDSIKVAFAFTWA